MPAPSATSVATQSAGFGFPFRLVWQPMRIPLRILPWNPQQLQIASRLQIEPQLLQQPPLSSPSRRCCYRRRPRHRHHRHHHRIHHHHRGHRCRHRQHHPCRRQQRRRLEPHHDSALQPAWDLPYCPQPPDPCLPPRSCSQRRRSRSPRGRKRGCDVPPPPPEVIRPRRIPAVGPA